MSYFRFEDLEIWQDAITIGDDLFDIAGLAENRRLFRFAEQLRAAGMSISNNIAEGSGSISKKEFGNFLNYARRSVFECANIIIIYWRRSVINNEQREVFMQRLSSLSRRITTFRRNL